VLPAVPASRPDLVGRMAAHCLRSPHMCDDEARAVDYLARVVIQTGKIAPIGFVHFKQPERPVSKQPPPKHRPSWSRRMKKD
jgi:hypothetical protein